jgi:radical SAM superfamily enzyme YgiQ (UPF0313 family)
MIQPRHNPAMPDIVLATLNARHAHAALGLRYLLANLGELEPRAAIEEFVIGQRSEQIAERLLTLEPKIIGLGIYIWNVEESTKLVALLKALRPDIRIVLGGPEVSHEVEEQAICALADHVVTGWGDESFPALCRTLLAGESATQLITGAQPPLDRIASPYRLYTDKDLAERHVYVEASRGCPYKCEFCLSALDRTAWPFPLAPFLAELDAMHRRGARHFKFVDRTFNLRKDVSTAILDFFLERIEQDPPTAPYAHFELIPDHLPEVLKERIARFPPGFLQFEIGIQSLDPDTQQRISRRQDNAKALENLRWLRTSTQAHLHVDLIAGLPGEGLESFARGFDQLVALQPHEIQVGLLKRLRGAPIARHTEAHRMRYQPYPPYQVLETDALDFPTLQRIARFARYWDLIANSGRFPRTVPLLLGESPFARFMAFADWLHGRTGQTHAFAHDRLVHLLHEYAESSSEDLGKWSPALAADYRGAGGRSRLHFAPEAAIPPPRPRASGATPRRQARHLTSPG